MEVNDVEAVVEYVRPIGDVMVWVTVYKEVCIMDEIDVELCVRRVVTLSVVETCVVTTIVGLPSPMVKNSRRKVERSIMAMINMIVIMGITLFSPLGPMGGGG
ncbi:hypothetical protein DRN93_03810 [archaeon]|nr:MAG: hypothetical protein DRN93_03810 [archaeon]